MVLYSSEATYDFFQILNECFDTGDKSLQSRETTENVQRAQSGNGQSFEWIILTYKEFVAKEARKYVRYQSIEDVTQETFIRLYRSLAEYVEEGKFQWWLRKLVVNSALDFLRQEQRNKSLKQRMQEHRSPDIGNKEKAAILILDLQKMLEEISPLDRLMATILFLEGRTQQEAAELLSLSLVNVKVRAFRLRKKLVKRFAA